MIKRKKYIVLLILFFIFVAIKLIFHKQNDGYSAITNYFKYSLKGDYKNAYKLLTDSDKKIVKIRDFETYFNLISQCEKVEGFKIIKNRELNDVIIGGTKYKKGIEYKIIITESVYYYNSVKSVTDVRTVVQENNQWKVLIKKNENISKMLAELEASVGQMYFTGKGKAKDYKKSQSLFKSAISRDKNCFRALYYLGVLDYSSHNYVDAINYLQKAIASCTDKKVKSDIFYVIGVCHYAENQTKYASQAFQKSLEMNSNNEFTKKIIAKYNLGIK